MDQNALDSTEPKLSPLFRDPNADVTFTSSDGVLFKIHRRHLEPTTGGFPVADAMVVGPEPVALPEPASVLEALFQFIQPPTEATNFRQPSIHNMQEDIFFAVAEAAEKYLVYGAMNTCITFMREHYKKWPVQALNHCARHGYTDLADKAAEASLRWPLNTVAQRLTHPSVLQRWVIYYNSWLEPLRTIEIVATKSKGKACGECAKTFTAYFASVIRDVSSAPDLLKFREDCASASPSSCPCRDMPALQRTLERSRQNIPKFSSIPL